MRFRVLQLVGVQHDGEGAVVHKRHLHIGGKRAGDNLWHVSAGERYKILVELTRQLRSARRRKRGPSAVPAIGIERELRHHEHRAAHIAKPSDWFCRSRPP